MVGNFRMIPTPEIHFGVGKLGLIPKIVDIPASKVIALTGKNSYSQNRDIVEMLNSLKRHSLRFEHYTINGEPTPTDIDSIVDAERQLRPGIVISIGGGSVIDSGKTVSAMLKEEGNVSDYLEGVGTKLPSGNKVKFIAVPTTSGTGSEMTSNAVITQYGAHSFKKSLRHVNYVPDYAVIDPALTLACSSELTTACGMDAFTQLIESYLSTKANPLTDSLALDGIIKMLSGLEGAVKDGNSIKHRINVAYAAMLSGITLANAGLGVVHGFAQPLGSLFKIPHGVVCGTLMAECNRVNLKKMLEPEDNTEAHKKYARLGKIVGCTSTDTLICGSFFVEYLQNLTDKLKLPAVAKYGVEEKDFDAIIQQTGLKNNPVALEEEDLLEILRNWL